MGLSLRKKALFLAIACMPLSVVLADGDGVTSENVVPFAYGDMDNWIVREIHESGIIGGNTKWLYELGPSDTIVGNTAFRNMGFSVGYFQRDGESGGSGENQYVCFPGETGGWDVRPHGDPL